MKKSINSYSTELLFHFKLFSLAHVFVAELFFILQTATTGSTHCSRCVMKLNLSHTYPKSVFLFLLPRDETPGFRHKWASASVEKIVKISKIDFYWPIHNWLSSRWRDVYLDLLYLPQLYRVKVNKAQFGLY